MDEISRDIKKGIAVAYINGQSYRDIAEALGVSTGSVSNVIKNLKSGRLDLPGIQFEVVGDLKQLSADLKGKNLSASQALLGFTMYQRLFNSGVKPEDIDSWIELLKDFNRPGFEPEGFFKSAQRLHDLEKKEDKSFEKLVEEYEGLQDDAKKTRQECVNMQAYKNKAVNELTDVNAQLTAAKQQTKQVEGDLAIKESRSKDQDVRIAEKEQAIAGLNGEIGQKRQEKHSLVAQVDTKQQAVESLRLLDFGEEELFRLQNMLKQMEEKRGGPPQDVFQEVSTLFQECGDIKTVREKKHLEMQELQEVRSLKSMLKGQVSALEQEKTLAQGYIQQVVKSTLQNIDGYGKQIVSALCTQFNETRELLSPLMVDIFKVGKAVGGTLVMNEKAEQARQDLKIFVRDIEEQVEK